MLSKANAICIRCGGLESAITLCRKCDHMLPLSLMHESSSGGLKNQLRSFAAPNSSLEAQSIRSAIDSAKVDLAHYRGLIKQIESNICQLEEHIAYQSSLLAPIRRLPLEVLTDVLKLVSDDEMSYFSNEFVDTYSMPSLALSHVCHSWKEIVMRMPGAWSSIEVGRAGELQLIRMYLDRSKSYPLTLNLSSYQHSDGTCKDHWRWEPDLVTTFGRQSRRWNHVHIDPEAMMGLTRIKGRLDQLEYLCINKPKQRVGALTGLDVFQNAPLLHIASIPAALFRNRHFALPWTSLRTLTLHQAKATDLLRVAELIRIKELHVVQLTDNFNPPPVFVRPKFCSLETLDVVKLHKDHTMPALSPSSFLRLLAAPQLTSLSLQSSDKDAEKAYIVCAYFDCMIALSNCMITVLRFDGLAISTNGLIAILKRSPSLVELKLSSLTISPTVEAGSNSPINHKLFQALLSGPSHSSKEFRLVANLRRLIIRDCFEYREDPQAQSIWLLMMLEERCLEAFENDALELCPLDRVELTFECNDQVEKRGWYPWKNFYRLQDLASKSTTVFKVIELKKGSRRQIV